MDHFNIAGNPSAVLFVQSGEVGLLATSIGAKEIVRGRE
jgi:hypothetical protein